MTEKVECNSTTGHAKPNGKCNKPLTEKRRRARINHCLAQMKVLILDGADPDIMSIKVSKMEKADILEATVNHIRKLRRKKVSGQNEEKKFADYRAGFTECAFQVVSYLKVSDSFTDDVRTRLFDHLETRLNTSNKSTYDYLHELPSGSNNAKFVPDKSSDDAKIHGNIYQTRRPVQEIVDNRASMLSSGPSSTDENERTAKNMRCNVIKNAVMEAKVLSNYTQIKTKQSYNEALNLTMASRTARHAGNCMHSINLPISPDRMWRPW